MRLSDVTSAGNFVRIVELFPPGVPLPHLMKDHEKYDLDLRFQRLADAVRRLESLADGFSLPELKDEQRIHLNSVAIAATARVRGNLKGTS